jgi:hypothetical protein
LVTKVSGKMMSSEPGRNDIINGGLVVNQENQTAPADAAHTIGDLFIHNGEGTPVMSLETSGGPQGTRPWQKMVLDSNAQGGLAYIVPNDTVQDYIANGKMSFGIQLRTVTGALLDTARIGILKWAGTANAVTKELVGTWASDGTDPTLATSLTYENTPADLALTNAWQRFTVENITVDTDTTNIVIFIWTDDGTITASDVIGFSEWQLNPGATVNDFSSSDYGTVLNQVLPYLERLNFDTVTGEVFPSAASLNRTTTAVDFMIPHSSKYSTPVITSSAGDTFLITYGAASTTAPISLGFSAKGKYGYALTANTLAVLTVGEVSRMTRDGTDTCWIMYDSRIGA